MPKLPNTKRAIKAAIAAQNATPATPATNTANMLPNNVTVAQPPNGVPASYGNIVTVGRKQYGGSYYATLTSVNYTLVNQFVTACLTAIKGSTAIVTPVKLSLQVNNVHGTSQRVGIVSLHGQTAQAHIRYLTAAGWALAGTLGLTVYGPNMGLPVGKQGPKAHSNHMVLTAANMPAVVKLFAAHAATIAAS